jgi:hypothetical protein
LGKPCYVESFIHIPLTSDHVKRWVDFVVIKEATIHEPPSILRRPWVEGYQRKQQLKNRKKKLGEADSLPKLSQTLFIPVGYMQNPLGLTNLPLGLGNLMYPANIGGLGLGGLGGLGDLGLNNPIILQISQPPAQAAINVLNSIPQVPLSSPLSAGADPIKRLEEYVQWHIKRTPSRIAPFNQAYSELTDRMYEFTDLHTISREEWEEMGVLSGISKVLKRDMKEYQRFLHSFGGVELEFDIEAEM